MARIRTIKPEFATDEKLAKVSRDARLTFVLCITQADDDGLLPGNHRQLLAALYPLDDAVTYAKLAAWIEELVESGRVQWRETVDGSPILEIVSWAKHQRVDHKGKSLILPHLKPSGEECATGSREIPEECATVSRSDLGPRTMDLRPTTGEQARVAKQPAWVRPLARQWSTSVGRTSEKAIHRELAESVATHGPEKMGAAIVAYAKAKRAGGKAMKLQWFAEDVVTWVLRGEEAKQPIVDATGALTPYGEMLTRPDRVPA